MTSQNLVCEIGGRRFKARLAIVVGLLAPFDDA